MVPRQAILQGAIRAAHTVRELASEKTPSRQLSKEPTRLGRLL